MARSAKKAKNEIQPKMQHSIGRPKKADSARRFLPVMLSLTIDEFDLLTREAEISGTPVSVLARESAVLIAKRRLETRKQPV